MQEVLVLQNATLTHGLIVHFGEEPKDVPADYKSACLIATPKEFVEVKPLDGIVDTDDSDNYMWRVCTPETDVFSGQYKFTMYMCEFSGLIKEEIEDIMFSDDGDFACFRRAGYKVTDVYDIYRELDPKCNRARIPEEDYYLIRDIVGSSESGSIIEISTDINDVPEMILMSIISTFNGSCAKLHRFEVLKTTTGSVVDAIAFMEIDVVYGISRLITSSYNCRVCETEEPVLKLDDLSKILLKTTKVLSFMKHDPDLYDLNWSGKPKNNQELPKIQEEPDSKEIHARMFNPIMDKLDAEMNRNLKGDNPESLAISDDDIESIVKRIMGE